MVKAAIILSAQFMYNHGEHDCWYHSFDEIEHQHQTEARVELQT